MLSPAKYLDIDRAALKAAGIVDNSQAPHLASRYDHVWNLAGSVITQFLFIAVTAAVFEGFCIEDTHDDVNALF